LLHVEIKRPSGRFLLTMSQLSVESSGNIKYLKAVSRQDAKTPRKINILVKNRRLFNQSAALNTAQAGR